LSRAVAVAVVVLALEVGAVAFLPTLITLLL
jgi:hypothetical protein